MDMEKILIADKEPRQLFETTSEKILKYSSAVVPAASEEESVGGGEFVLPGGGLVDLATLSVAGQSTEVPPTEEEMAEDFANLAKSVSDMRTLDAIPGSYWPRVIEVLEKFLSSSAAPRMAEGRLKTVKPIIELMKLNEAELMDNRFLDHGVVDWLGNIDTKVHDLLEPGG